MEIYKDEVYDLLVDRETVCIILPYIYKVLTFACQAVKLPVRENESGQVFVANLSVLPLETLDDFEDAFT